MIDVLVRDEYRLDERCVPTGGFEAPKGLASGEPRVDEQRTLLPPEIGAVSFATAGEDCQFHCRNGGLCVYLRSGMTACRRSLGIRGTNPW